MEVGMEVRYVRVGDGGGYGREVCEGEVWT